MTTAQGTTLHEELLAVLDAVSLDNRSQAQDHLHEILAAFHRAGWRPGADALIDRYQGKAAAANRRADAMLAENDKIREEMFRRTHRQDYWPYNKDTFDGAGILQAITALQDELSQQSETAPLQAWDEGFYTGRNYALTENPRTMPLNPYAPICGARMAIWPQRTCALRKHESNLHKDKDGKQWWG